MAEKNLYTVIVADDEDELREAVCTMIPWEALGFHLVGSASNGLDALELVEQLEPDLLLTDIRMPFITGIELARQVREIRPAMHIAFLSGYDEFEYAKQAIQMNVVEYILKPINADELSAVLRRLKEQLDRERAERRNVELLRSRYMENLPILRELFYANLLDGHIEPGTERERAARLDIDLQGEEWAVGLAYIGSDRRDALSTLSVQKLLEESLTADRCRLTLYNDWVAVIVSLTESFTIYDLIRVLDRVCTLAASYLGLTLTVGVGAPCKELSGMARSAAEARTALEYRSMVGRGQVIYIGDLEPDTGESDSTIRWSTEVESTKVSYTDINHDGILELPSAYALPDPNNVGTAPNFWAIRWWQYDINGVSHLVYTTYHNSRDGWYFVLPEAWSGKVTLSRSDLAGGGERAVIFSYWEGSADTAPVPFLVIYKLTGDNRVMRANMADRFLLPNTGEEKETIYAARLIESGWDCGLDEEGVKANFALITSD